jgi:hypothetical protein
VGNRRLSCLREQVGVTRGMDVELKEHRRLSRTIECDGTIVGFHDD